ncbi:tetratricopeptide repeat protein [bacterium]|nr:tetratricopeptide repeat protein [candidate division CSSED10-310 bacterium]
MNRSEDQKTDQFRPINHLDHANGSDSNRVYSADPELNQWIIEGIEKLDRKDFKSAIKLFEKVLRVDPDNMSAFEKLSIARSVQADIDRISEYMAMGRELMNQREWQGAGEEFQAVLAIDADHEEARTCMNQIRMHLQNETGEPEPAEAGEMEITLGGESIFEFTPAHDYVSDPNIEPDQDTVQTEHYLSENSGSGSSTIDPQFQNRLEEALRIYENGNLDRAQELLEELQGDYPDQEQIAFYLTAISRRLESDQVRQEQSNVETLFKQGMDMLEQQDFTGARTLFQKVLQIRPDFEQAQLLLDRVDSMSQMVSSGRPGGIKPTHSGSPRMTSTDDVGSKSSRPLPPPPPKPRTPGSSKLMIVGGLILVIGILAAIGFFLFQFPKMRFDNLTSEAKARFRDKAYVEAIALLESAVVIRPDDFEAIRLLGDAYSASGNPMEAVNAYQNALALNPEDLDLVLKLADAQFAAKLWGAAETTYHRLTGELRFKEGAFYQIGLARKNRGLIDDAIMSFRETLAVNEAHSMAHFELAKCLEQQALHAEAELAFQQAISTDPKFMEGYEVLSDFYRQKGEHQKAAEVLTRLLAWYKPTTLDKSKQVARLREKLGEDQYNSEDYLGAVESFTSVIQIEPTVEAFRNLGRAHYKTGKLTEAILVWRRGLELDDRDADLHFQIAVALFRQGDMSGAEAGYKEALRIKPDFVKALTNLGFLYYQNYRYDMARGYWQQSLAIDPTQEEVRRRLKEIEKK